MCESIGSKAVFHPEERKEYHFFHRIMHGFVVKINTVSPESGGGKLVCSTILYSRYVFPFSNKFLPEQATVKKTVSRTEDAYCVEKSSSRRVFQTYVVVSSPFAVLVKV
jgi:hypothetical protein